VRGIYFGEWETKRMNREDFITFYLWQKMSAKGNVWNLFSDFLIEKVKKDKEAILAKWNEVERLLKEIEKELELNN
jgi:hypothetical protein